MSDFVVSKAAVSGTDMVQLVDQCRNSTVGANKYQLFCVSTSQINGACTLLPSKYTSGNGLDCVYYTSQTFLRLLYDQTGNACALNCYYPLDGNTPLPPLPNLSSSGGFPTISSGGFPSASAIANPRPSVVLSRSASGSSVGAPSASPSPVLTSGGLSDFDTSFTITFMAVFAVLFVFVRRMV